MKRIKTKYVSPKNLSYFRYEYSSYIILNYHYYVTEYNLQLLLEVSNFRGESIKAMR